MPDRQKCLSFQKSKKGKNQFTLLYSMSKDYTFYRGKEKTWIYVFFIALQERGKNDLIELFEKVKKELEARKRENDELREMIETENDKRMRESEAIKKRLEREKQELRDFLAEDKEKLTSEMLAANQVGRVNKYCKSLFNCTVD